jgi:TolB-like protein
MSQGGQERSERRLAAILAADVAGYSRLMGADEEGTLAHWKAHWTELIAPKMAEHHGRVVRTTGDGILAEFASIVEATRCAVALQRGMLERNAQVPQDKRIEFRIGLNLGDIIIDGADIYGDGVNVAARLEALCEPGSICVSRIVYEQVRDKVDVGFEDSGEQQLKNIARPVRIYRARLGAAAERPRPALPLPDKPSIAVLPFLNMSGDQDQEYFADAVTEDILTALSRWRWFFVIARNSSFIYKGRVVDVKEVARELGVRYVLEGSVRKVRSRIRVTGQLIDASNAAHIWADNFDRELADILALQDEITERVVTAIEPAMLHSEGMRVARKNLRDLSAFDCFQRGMWHFNKVSPDSYREALSLFRQAIDHDPELSLGHIGLARTLYGTAVYGWSSQPLADYEEARSAAQTAIGLDARDAYGHFALAGAALYLGRHDEAFEEAERAVALNPNFALGHFRLGQVLVYIGRPAEAVAPVERSLRHNPYDPQLGGMLALLGLAHYHAGNYPQAVRQAEAGIRLHSGAAWAVLAASLARLGRIEAAREAFARWRSGTSTTERHLAPYARPADRDDLIEGLRLAGASLTSGKAP